MVSGGMRARQGRRASGRELPLPVLPFRASPSAPPSLAIRTAGPDNRAMGEERIAVRVPDAGRDERPHAREEGTRDPDLPTDLIALQRLAGNAAVAGLLGRSAVLPVQRDRRFDQAAGPVREQQGAPQEMTLPEELTEGMQDAWDNSFDQGRSQEQGGILVLTTEGQYEWRAGVVGESGSWDVNYDDARGDTIIAVGHTHPYDETEGSYEDVSFSGEDLAGFVDQIERIQIVQSGSSQFVVSRTSEFDAEVEACPDAAAKEQLRTEMETLWNETFDATVEEKGFVGANRDAVIAVCNQYHLVYSEGRGGTVRQPPPNVHVEMLENPPLGEPAMSGPGVRGD